MTKPQWLVAGLAIALAITLYASTEKQLFGERTVKLSAVQPTEAKVLPIDSILLPAKKTLTPEQQTRLELLEHSISRGDVKTQQEQVYHQLAHFWADTAKRFEPYAWYLAEAARLENSEKSLTFAARLFLDRLTGENQPAIRQWEASQSKDLFERSLKLNPENDSAKIGLGAVYIYGGVGMPMQGITLLRQVVDKDSNNIYAQMTLGQASVASGQLPKAVDRFKTVIRLRPNDPEAVLQLADVYEQMGNKAEAVIWYAKSLPLIGNPAIKKEVEARIAELKK